MDKLTDEEFEDCLQKINDYFRKNPDTRKRWDLKDSVGPQSAADRLDEERMDYLGAPKKFKFYSYK